MKFKLPTNPDIALLQFELCLGQISCDLLQRLDAVNI